MSQYHLGEFEEIVLLTVGILHGNAYGMSIIEEIEQRLGRTVSIGALQTVLRRLEEKGLLDSEFGEATAIRGGKRKRFFALTITGRSILNETREQRQAMWKAIPKTVFR